MTPLHKQSQGILLKGGDRGGVEPEFPAAIVPAGGAAAHVADPQGRGQGFGKGIQVDDPFVPVQTLELREWGGRKTKLTVIIVL